MQNFTLEVAQFEGSHNGENIQKHIEAVLERWGLQRSNVAILFRDNGSNIVKACRLMKVIHEGCIRHGIHLVVGTFQSLNENEDADPSDYPPVDLDDEEMEMMTNEKVLATSFRSIGTKLKKLQHT